MDRVRGFRLVANENKHFWIPEMNLFLGAWDGKRSQVSTTWLRWWEHSGNLLLWSKEIIEQEKLKAEQERQRAEQAESRLQQEQVMCQRFVDRLKAVGVDADLDEE